MNIVIDRVIVRKQARESLVLRVTPEGLVVLAPSELDPDGETVRDFIEKGIARLPKPELVTEPMAADELDDLIATWSERLVVEISRVQVRKMQTKWASCSSQGTLTLNQEILHLHHDLVEYILCHELLHRKVPDHNQSWQLLMGIHLPDWREREWRLAAWMLQR